MNMEYREQLDCFWLIAIEISVYIWHVFFQYCKYTTASPLADSFYKRPSYSFPFCLFELLILSEDSASRTIALKRRLIYGLSSIIILIRSINWVFRIYNYDNMILFFWKQNTKWKLIISQCLTNIFSSVSSCLNAVFPGLYFINFNMCKWQCKLHLRSSTSYANTCVIFNLFTIGFDILYIIFLAPYLNSFWCFLSVE